MKKYNFIVKKTQTAYIETDWDENETIGDVAKRIEKMDDEEIKFGETSYHLEAISKEDKKVYKIIWRSKIS